MSYYDDIFDDWLAGDEREDEDDDGVRCKFCGKFGLHWRRWAAKPELLEANGETHRCDEEHTHRKARAQFEVLP